MTATTSREQLAGVDRLRRLFAPESIAIVGASETSSWARNLVHSISLVPGTTSVVPVNPKHREMFGRTAVPTLRELAEPVDLAFVLVGPDRVEGVLEDAAAVGIRNAIVLAGGYGEAGGDGPARQASLAAKAAELDLTILGPNTIGFLNASRGFAPWAVATEAAPIPGSLGAVFESGSMARATFQFAQAHGVGSSLWVSAGNAVVVDSLDVMELLVADDSTRAIALFLETIKDAERFLAVSRRALEAGKPVVAFKAGRSEEGQRQAQAHTGALATDDAVVDAAFRQAGVVRVESLEELIATAGLLAHSKRLPAGRRMGVVTSSGGGCNIIADLAVREELELPAWTQETVDRLLTEMPPHSHLLNPLDTTGYGHARARKRPTKAEDDLLEVAAPDGAMDFMVNMMTPLPSLPPVDPAAREAIEERMRIVGGIVNDAPVPVFLTANTCMDVTPYAHSLLADNGLFLLPGVDLGLKAIGHAARWTGNRQRALSAPRPGLADTAPAAVSDIQGAWAEDEGRALLESAGVGTVPAVLATSAADAVAAAAGFGVPVALKVCSREVAHKSDVGGVRLGLTTGIAEAYDEILRDVGTKVPEATLRGVLVSPMRPPGVELMVGVTRDPTFGPVLAIALGGIWVEVLKDSVLRVLPVSAEGVREMLEELRGISLLTGGRGQVAVDLDALSADIARIADVALSLGADLQTLEVNPLRIVDGRPEALDVLVET